MFIDSHAHVFNHNHVPDKFLGIRLKLKGRFLNFISNTLGWIIPGTDDKLENIAEFIRGLNQTVEENFLELHNVYSRYDINYKVCLLLMNMEAISGKTNESYSDQITQMLELKRKYPKHVKLFLYVDPNNSTSPMMMHLYHITNGIFDGIKIYPSLNAIPNRPEFDKMYAMAEHFGTPIIAHCNKSGVAAPDFWAWNKWENNNPKNWEPVLNKYPKLKLCLAHYATSDKDWRDCIRKLCAKYENVYTDISFMVGNAEEVERLVREPTDFSKILYGSDSYMVALDEWNIAKILMRTKNILGSEIFTQISETNPMRFLGVKND